MCSSHGAHMWKRTCQDSHYRNTIHWCLSILPTHPRGFPWTSFTCSKGWPKNGTRQWHEVRRVELVERWSVKSLKQMIWRVSNLAFQTTHLGFHGSSAGATPMKSLPRSKPGRRVGVTINATPPPANQKTWLPHLWTSEICLGAHLRPSWNPILEKWRVFWCIPFVVLGGQNDVLLRTPSQRRNPATLQGTELGRTSLPDRCLTSVSFFGSATFPDFETAWLAAGGELPLRLSGMQRIRGSKSIEVFWRLKKFGANKCCLLLRAKKK